MKDTGYYTRAKIPVVYGYVYFISKKCSRLIYIINNKNNINKLSHIIKLFRDIYNYEIVLAKLKIMSKTHK